MIKDQLFKRLFIPVAGFCFPLLAGLVHPGSDTPLYVAGTTCVFIGLVFLVWVGIVQLTSRLRTYPAVKRNVFFKLISISVVAALYAGLFCFAASASWVRITRYPFSTEQVWKATVMGSVGGTLLALMYEVVFLSVEKELDSRVLQQIDRERQEAEVNVLKNELDPHFFFNCMNTLSYLVREDKDKAYQFVHKLSNIYKYFLRNKAADVVPLKEELAFLDNYYFLLRIRFEDNIRIENTIAPADEDIYIIPCTLQVLVENAMKHNFFSEKEPLEISISLNQSFITVSSPVRPKPSVADSTKTGLRNLKARYRLITNQNVLVQKTASRFLVKLPIVKQTNGYDKSSDH